MFDFFSQVLGYIEVWFHSFFNMLEATFLLLSEIPASISLTGTLSTYVPTILGSSILAVVAIGAVKLIMGR